MKKYFKQSALLIGALISLNSCSKEDKLNPESVLTEENRTKTELDHYLDRTFVEPFNIDVHYRFNRNFYGKGNDVLRNLYPPKVTSVWPAMEMVDLVWIQSYVEVAGSEFVETKRPVEFILAGGPALNDDGTRTLGIASAGARITLFELDAVVSNKNSAKEFIHTIQHEYIHIINMKKPFDELDFAIETQAGYSPTWYQQSDATANGLGFITAYARLNSVEDFAETASYLLTHTKAEYDALIASLKAGGKADGASKIETKVEKVKAYFAESFDVDFLELCEVANRNAASSPLLGRTAGKGTTSSKSTSIYSMKEGGKVHYCDLGGWNDKH